MQRFWRQLSEAQFIKETKDGHGSLRGTLVHVLSAEWMWRSRWQGTSPKEDLRAEDLPTLGALARGGEADASFS